jgi:hypothetical protein
LAGEATPLPIVWRVGRAGRIASRTGVALSALTILGVATWVVGWPDADKLAAALVAAFGLVLALMLWRAGIHPSVAATEAGLVIRNPLETVTVPWEDLVEAAAGFDGVRIGRLSAPPTTIWAVQKANFSTWSGARTRADAVAAKIQELAAARGAPAETTRSGAKKIARREVEPFDAFREPLRFPWRMTRVEAAVIGFLRHSSSPRLSAASALVFGALGLTIVGFFAIDQGDAHLLQERGVVVQGTVLEVPGLVKVTWPGIAPESIFLEGGDHAADEYSVGEVVDVRSDPQHPTRARLVGVEPGAGENARQIAVALGALLLASAYAKWSRWLAVAHRDAPPTPPGRHRAGGRH